MRRTSLLLLVGLSFGCVSPVPAVAQPSSIAASSMREPHGELIAEAAQRFALPAAWICAVMRPRAMAIPALSRPRARWA
jgi:hypothetical protein